MDRRAGWALAGVLAGGAAVVLRRSARAARPSPGAPHVVIVGAGFAGLAAARSLAGLDLRVTVLDRRNHHLFQPLLYQVATAALSPGDIAAPVRAVLRDQGNVEVLLAEAERVDADGHAVVLVDGGRVPYDALVVATGATHSYLGHEEWAPLAPGLKTLEDALEIRRRVLTAYERAEREDDAAARTALLTFVVVGAGPTGVELAGALSEIARHTLAGDFRRIAPASARVVLLELVPRVLPAYSERLSAAARRQLEALGVEVRTGARVTGIDAEGVEVSGARIAARTVLWGAGVAASPLARGLGAPLDPSGRVEVRPDLSLPARPEIFVAGDLARVVQDGALVPGIAPAAIQAGRRAARNAARRLRGRPTVRFRYRDRGALSTIGRAAAVGTVFGVELSGLPAWLAWLGIHIAYLIGFRNRVAVLLEWAWSYATFKRGARLITETAEQGRLEHALRRPMPPDVPAPAAGPALTPGPPAEAPGGG
ncbi:MAG TPA: NAD(P)/FAD-dependent oxidoreductase [Anaeromyxobacter sp.]